MTEGFFVGSPQSEEIFSGAIREVKEETGVTKSEHICCHSFPSDISFYVFPTHANPFSPLFYPFRLTLHFWKWLLSGKSSQLLIQPAIKENLVHFYNTTFKKIYRHAHNVTFEKSDLFFVCMLKPLSFEIAIDEQEIDAAKVMKNIL